MITLKGGSCRTICIFFPQHFQLEDIFERKILVYDHFNCFHLKRKATGSQLQKKKSRLLFCKIFPKGFFSKGILMEKTTFPIQLFSSGDLTDFPTTGCGKVKSSHAEGRSICLAATKKKSICCFPGKQLRCRIISSARQDGSCENTTRARLFHLLGWLQMLRGRPHHVLHHLLFLPLWLLDCQHRYHISHPQHAVSTSPMSTFPEVSHFRRRHISKSLWTLSTSGATLQ